MLITANPNEGLLEENERLRLRLEEAEATIEAIRNGLVDAVVVCSPTESVLHPGRGRPSLPTTGRSDGTGRRNVESGWCDSLLQFVPGRLLKLPVEMVIGTTAEGFVAGTDQGVWTDVLQNFENMSPHQEIRLRRPDGSEFPQVLS